MFDVGDRPGRHALALRELNHRCIIHHYQHSSTFPLTDTTIHAYVEVGVRLRKWLEAHGCHYFFIF